MYFHTKYMNVPHCPLLLGADFLVNIRSEQLGEAKAAIEIGLKCVAEVEGAAGRKYFLPRNLRPATCLSATACLSAGQCAVAVLTERLLVGCCGRSCGRDEGARGAD